MDILQNVTKTLTFKIGSLEIATPYWQVGAILVLLFLLVVVMAQYRHHTVHWSLKGATTGIFFGFLLALILEGFLIIGGRTALTELLGWKSAPKPISTALDKGRSQLVEVLGITSEIPTSNASEDYTPDEAVKILQSLDPTEIKKVKSLICNP